MKILPNVEILDAFKSFIKKNNLFSSDDTVLLAVSGGIDSIVMAYLFQLSGYKFAIAHCNFGLRGTSSDKDEALVKNLATKFSVPFYTNRFSTLEYASGNKLSTQMAARELRYNWFQELITSNNYQYLATAHHKNDNVETVLFNLIKGTGIRGLHGIKPKRENIIRPMLFATKGILYLFADQEKIEWREDISNRSNKYARNKIRNEVIPALKSINPSFEDTFESTIKRISGVESILDWISETYSSKCIQQNDGHISIDLQPLSEVPSAYLILFEWIKAYGFTLSDAQDMFVANESISGKKILSGTHQLIFHQKVWQVHTLNHLPFKEEKISARQSKVDCSDFSLTLEKTENEKIENNPQIALLDYNLLKFPLKLRKWKEGDYFYPLGMDKKKKISDFLIDNKISIAEKERVYVITSNGQIVWVVGHRIDNRFKVTENTQILYKMSVTQNT